MLYARVDIETKQVLEFPLSMAEVRQRLQKMNISAQPDFRSADLTHLGFYGVAPDAKQPMAPPGYRTIVGDPIWKGNRLVRRWTIVPADKDFEDRLWVKIRQDRDRLLRESDWTELPSIQEIRSEKWLQEWATYRQQLRDITNTRYPTAAIFPRRPNETE